MAPFRPLGEKPPEPPPDPDKPYLWFDGQWVLLATDTQDGVPDSLDLPEKHSVNTKLDSEPGSMSRRLFRRPAGR